MSNGYVLAAAADAGAAREVGEAFGLEPIDTGALGDQEAVSAAAAGAANVGLILSLAASEDSVYAALLQNLAGRLQRAQLILVEADARAAFAFLPEAWPTMTLEDARMRAAEMARRRQEAVVPGGASEDSAQAPVEEAKPEPETPAEPSQAQAQDHEQVHEHEAAEPSPLAGETASPDADDGATLQEEDAASETSAAGAPASESEAPPAEEPAAAPPPLAMPAPAPTMPPAPEPPTLLQPGPDAEERATSSDAPPPATAAPAPAPQAPAPQPARKRDSDRDEAVAMGRSAAAGGATAPADATAFAPKKLRRGAPELVQVVIHQPKDLKAVIKAARKADPRAEAAPQGMPIGDVALGASLGVALETRGVACDGTMQRRTWAGDPLHFSFSVEAEEGVRQAVFIARVFIGDAQIGVIGFTRQISGPKKNPASAGDAARLKRHRRVFLSYSSKDREAVAAIATAYESAGVPHFFDRTSLKSGEQWHPRLRREIDRADLFHLCWSKSAAASEWVEKETEHALTRQKRSNGKNPAISVQMLDGPPWAPHPPHLDAINFDDFVRAAIVGYARGEG